MAYLTIGREITRGTICRDRWSVDMTLATPDRLPLGRIVHFFLRLSWRGGARGTAKLQLIDLSAGAGGEVRFGGGEGPLERSISGAFAGSIPVIGMAPTVGTEADVALRIFVQDEEVATVLLSVGDTERQLAIHAIADDLQLPGELSRSNGFRATLTAETEGEYRWLANDPDLLLINSGGSPDRIEVAPTGPPTLPRAIGVLFRPADGGPDMFAVRWFGGTLRQVENAFWTRDLTLIEGGTVRPGQVVEMVGVIANPQFRLDARSRVRVFILEKGNLLGSRDDRVLALLGPETDAGPRPFHTVSRKLAFRCRAAEEAPADAVRAFRVENPADYFEHLLILEEKGPQRGYHIIGWWTASAIADGFSPQMYFVFEFGGQQHIASSSAEWLTVSGDPVTAPELPPVLRLRISGRLVDAAPFATATPEPLGDVQLIASGKATLSEDDGRFVLEAPFLIGETQTIEINRRGIEPLYLNLTITKGAAGQISVTAVERSSGRAYGSLQHGGSGSALPIELMLGDVAVRVHKMRGTVRWPDSRVTDDPRYRGTPLAGRRVYALPVEDGDIAAQRPQTTRGLEELKRRPGVLRSNRPGRPVEGERTGADGSFEIRYLDLTAGSRYLIWVESPHPDDSSRLDGDVEAPEYCVRTHYRELLELTGSRASNRIAVGRHLIDHHFNLSRSRIEWSVEALKIIEVDRGGGNLERLALRPTRSDPAAFDTDLAAGEPIAGLDADALLITGFEVLSLPLIAIDSAPNDRGERANAAWAGLMQSMDAAHPRGHHTLEGALVLDASRIETGIDLSNGTWEGAWNAADIAASRQRRTCELLERTFLLSPTIPSAYLRGVEEARWRVDAETLADHALIETTTPAGRPLIANRRLTSTWIAVLQPVLPRLLGLASGRHLYLAPGHGFFDAAPPSTNPADWASQRGGYNHRSGEDENVGFLSSVVDRIARRQGATVTSAREIRDFTRPGVTHPRNNTFTVSTDPDFLRLWQQNPVYYLGIANHTIVIGTNLGLIAGDHNSKGINARRSLASALAGATDPIHLMLAIHTNASDGTARGVSAFYLDVETSTTDNTEFNTMGRGYSTLLRDELVDRANMVRRNVLPLTTLGSANSDLQNTFDYWTRTSGGANSAVRQRVRAAPPNAAGWVHRTFPATIPVSLVEVGFHDNAEDGGLLSRAWFRRVAGEALASATEAQLRNHPALVTRAEVVRLLAATFGPTDRVRSLTADNTTIDGDLGAYVQSATGVANTPTANNLAAAVTTIEAARNVYTRSDLLRDLSAAFADVAGFASGDSAGIEELVTRTILPGGTPGLSRGAMASTRGDAGEFVARAFAWKPETLDTVISRVVDGVRLMDSLAGEAAGEAFLPQVEVTELVARIRAIPPNRLYRATRIVLERASGERIPSAGSNAPFAARPGSRVRFRAETVGVPWSAQLSDIRFSLSGNQLADVRIAAERRLDGISSETWSVPADLTAPIDIEVTLEVSHRSLGAQRFKTERFTILPLL